MLIFAISLVPMLLAAGGAVDFTRYYNAQQNVQTALDAATLAGAAVYDGSNATAAEASATKTFASWNKSFNGTISDTTFTPTSDSDALYLTGTAHVSLNMYFTGLIGMKTLPFTVIAKAERAGTDSSDSSLCFLAKSTANAYVVYLNSSGTINAPDCEVGIASPYEAYPDGNTSESKVYSSKLCVAGSLRYNNSYPENYEAGCTPDADPYADADSIPIPTGDQQSVSATIESSTTLYPGTYTSSVTFQNSPTITFAPGTYILKGSTFLFDSGTIATGTGVTFYFADDSSQLKLNSGATVTLSAPTSGTYKGILMFDNPELDSDTELDIGGTANWSGVIHLTGRDIHFNSSSTTNVTGLMVTNTAHFDSTVNISGGTTTSTAAYGPPRLVK